jgi:hypothetical protein
MAWIFALNAECGGSVEDARAVAEHFASWPTGVQADADDNWWCWAAPAGLSRSGITTAEDAVAMTEAGHQLYDRLRTAPARYRYALVGVETDEFRTYRELVEDDDLTRFPGLVLDKPTWAATGRSPGFVPFTPGYRWLPYRGEHLDAVRP